MEKVRKFFISVLLFGIILLFPSPTFAIVDEAAEPAFGYGNLLFVPEQQNTVTVFGFGSSKGVPDQVQVSFGLSAGGQTANLAQQLYRERLDGIIATLAQEGLPKGNISTHYFNIWPDYGFAYDGREGDILGYRVNSTVNVHLTDVNLVPKVIDLVLTAGAQRVEGIRYLTSQQSRLRQEAMLAAIRDAYAQAEFIAAAFGRELGKVLAVDLSSLPPYELREGQVFTPEYDFGSESLTVTQFVRVVFSLN
ncbi:MAG: SIMPL domain-containing protein [bacterium]|jgi:uncharacterized protein YggE